MLPKSVSALIVTLALGLALPGANPLYGAQEDVALFQEALSPYGQWLNLGQHGPVWRPTQVARSWRPYTNGRWVPTQEGYVFETEEPWGWATYHYGNWLPTQEHGWVWVPGRTWYPHTVNWRSNDDNVGWAPVPPDYGGSDSYSSGRYADSYGASPGLNSYGSPPSSWVFTRASDFLLGWDQPYSSRYSYANAGLLLGPQYIPVVYERTVFVNNFVTPSYAPRACYNWGPPVTYITKVTNIKNIDLERRGRERRLEHLRNVMPPERVSRRHPAWREVLPVTDETRQRHIRRVASAGRLNRPDAIPAPRSLTRSAAAGAERLSPPEPVGQGAAPGLDRRHPGSPLQEAGRHTPPVDRSSPPPRLMTGPYPARGTTPAPPLATTPARPNREVARHRPPEATPPQPLQPSPDRQAGTLPSPRENRLEQAQPPRGRHQLPYPDQALRHRQQRAYPNQPPQQAPERQQVQMEQQRQQAQMQQRQQQAEMQRQQQALQEQQRQQVRQQQLQMENQRQQAEMQRQQHRQVEMQRQQQAMQEQQRQQARQHQLQMENQRRQAEMQQRQQAEMMRARQMQQQPQVVRQAPPPPAAAPPPRQKKRENQ